MGYMKKDPRSLALKGCVYWVWCITFTGCFVRFANMHANDNSKIRITLCTTSQHHGLSYEYTPIIKKMHIHLLDKLFYGICIFIHCVINNI